MSTTVMEVQARLTGDASGMVRAFSTARRSAETTTREIGRRGTQMRQGFETLAAPAAVVGGGLVLSAKKIGDWASEAEQNVGAVNSVFKKYADDVLKNSEKASSAVGISKSEYQSFSVLIGSQLKNLKTPMDQIQSKSAGMISTAADLASMFGGTTADAVAALSSALKGEMNPIEKYGITLNMATLKTVALEKGLMKSVVSSEKVASATTKVEIAQSKVAIATKKYGAESLQAKTAMSTLETAERGLAAAQKGKLPEMDAATKALAVQAAIMDQSKDAAGNFAKETDTVAHKQQVASAAFRDAATKIGTLLLPAFAAVADAFGKFADWASRNSKLVLIMGVSIGVLAGGIVGIVAVMKLWSYWTAAVNIVNAALNTTMKANVIFLIVAALVALVAGLVLAYQKVEWFRKAVDFAWKVIKASVKAVVDWLVGTAWPVIKDVLKWMGDRFVWLYENAIKPAWAFIKAAVKNVVDWMMNTAWPVIRDVLKWLGDKFMWLYQNIIKPVWSGIRAYINVQWQIIKLVFDVIVWMVKNVVAPIFTWFYQNIIKPVWNGVSQFISDKWSAIKAVFRLIYGVVKNTLGPVFSWFYNSIIKPVWAAIKTVLAAFGNYVSDHVAPKFQAGVSAIATIWNGLKAAALKPINFIIDTVFNKGIVGTFNRVAKAVGSDAHLSELPLIGGGGGNAQAKAPNMKGGVRKAFAKGGLPGSGWKLVGEEGPELVDFRHPGRVYNAKSSESMLKAAQSMNPSEANAIAGSGKTAMPMGGWFSDVKRNAGIALKMGGAIRDAAVDKVKSVVRGGFANALQATILPAYNTLTAGMDGNPMGGLIRDMGSNLIKKMIDRARGDDKIAKKADAAAAAAGGGGGGGEVVGSYNGKNGAFHRPSSGPYTSYFGPRGGGFHAGIDIAGGGKTYAALSGLVKAVSWGGGLPGRTGIGIRIAHAGGLQTYYGHNPSYGAVKVRPGQQVKGGQWIGMQGMTGNATGVHVHFETLRNGAAVNPLGYLRDKGGPIYPGTNIVQNNTGQNEMALTGGQWNLAKQALTNGGTGGFNVRVQVNLNGVDVNDKKTLERTGEEVGKQVWNAVRAASRGGVYGLVG